MSYRDESYVLREKVLSLANDQAKLEGELAGLKYRERELNDTVRRLQTSLSLTGVSKTVKRGTGRIFGVLGLILGVIGFCFVSAFLLHACENSSQTLEATMVGRDGEAIGAATIQITDNFIDSCEVLVRSTAGELYRGTGTCRGGRHGDEYWDHGTPSFVLATDFGQAVLRNGPEVTTFQFRNTE